VPSDISRKKFKSNKKTVKFMLDLTLSLFGLIFDFICGNDLCGSSQLQKEKKMKSGNERVSRRGMSQKEL
jgi:hypothetical protein